MTPDLRSPPGAVILLPVSARPPKLMAPRSTDRTMPNRFDIFITRIETKSARDSGQSHPIGDQHRSRGDKADAKPVRSAESLAEKNRAKHRHKNDA